MEDDQLITMEQIEEGTDIYNKSTVILWGCGVLGEQFLTFAKKVDIIVHACCDNDETKWGTEFYGIPVISPQELKILNHKCIKKGDGKELLVQLAMLAHNEKVVLEQLPELEITQVVQTITIFKGTAHLAVNKFLLKYPQFNDDIGKHFRKKKRTTFVFPDWADSDTIAICQPPKTGDMTLSKTFEENNVPYFFHDTNQLY